MSAAVAVRWMHSQLQGQAHTPFSCCVQGNWARKRAGKSLRERLGLRLQHCVPLYIAGAWDAGVAETDCDLCNHVGIEGW